MDEGFPLDLQKGSFLLVGREAAVVQNGGAAAVQLGGVRALRLRPLLIIALQAIHSILIVDVDDVSAAQREHPGVHRLAGGVHAAHAGGGFHLAVRRGGVLRARCSLRRLHGLIALGLRGIIRLGLRERRAQLLAGLRRRVDAVFVREILPERLVLLLGEVAADVGHVRLALLHGLPEPVAVRQIVIDLPEVIRALLHIGFKRRIVAVALRLREHEGAGAVVAVELVALHVVFRRGRGIVVETAAVVARKLRLHHQADVLAHAAPGLDAVVLVGVVGLMDVGIQHLIGGEILHVHLQAAAHVVIRAVIAAGFELLHLCGRAALPGGEAVFHLLQQRNAIL